MQRMVSLSWLLGICLTACSSAPIAVSDAGSDSGPSDGGFLYTPYACADAGDGSPFDRVDGFVAADGTNVSVTICGPRSGGGTLAIAIPDGGSAAQLFAEAAATAADGGAGTILIAPGRYDFSGGDGGLANWMLNGVNDLLIDGQGATLVFHGLRAGILLRQSHRVLIRNLQIDWSEPLAVGGTLKPGSALCDGGLAFAVDAAYPIDPASPLPLVSMSEFDVAGPAWPTTPFQQAYWAQQPPSARPQYSGAQSYCVVQPQALAGVASGTPAIGIARINGANGVYVLRSGDVSLENVTVFAAPGEGFTIYDGDHGFRLSGCRVLRNALDPTRLISSNADGVNFRQTQGDVLLESSEFADQGDDGVNILGQSFAVDAGSSSTELFFGPLPAQLVVAGDSLLLSGPDFVPVATATVAQVTPILDAGVVVGSVLQLVPPGVLLGDGGSVFAADAGLLVNVPARSSPNFILRNVYVHDNDQRALLVQTRNGLVDGFHAAHDRGALLLATSGVFLEGPGASNVTVRNSLFEGCDFMASLAVLSCSGGQSASPAPLSVLTLAPANRFAPAHPNSNILLENNVIDGAPGIGVLVASATGVRVADNTVVNTNQQTLATSCGPGVPLPVGSLVALDSTDVTFSGNSRDGGTTLGLMLDPSCLACSGQPNY